MIKPKAPFFTLDTYSESLALHKGLWIMVMKASNLDIDMMSDSEKETVLSVFQQILNSFNTRVQIIQRRKPLDISKNILTIESAVHPHEKVKEYAIEHKQYFKEMSVGKLDVESLIVIKSDKRYDHDDASQIFLGIKNQLTRAFKSVNIEIEQVVGLELKNILQLPDFIKEEIDYLIYGKSFIRTYVVLDYPRNGYPNWLRPLLNFPHPIELTQHLHPYPKDKIVHSLEVSISKMKSTVSMIEDGGSIAPAEVKVKIKDASGLMERLASGKDKIIETSFLITISANSLEKLNRISHEAEAIFRSLELVTRRARKEMNKALRSIIPLCNDELMELYTFDSKSLSTLVPFTAKNFSSGGILYGICADAEELITMDRYAMPNPNKIILGSSGYGKSMLIKIVDISRELITGTQIIVIDHNYEYRTICSVMGGQYVDEGDAPNWNSHMLVFGGNKAKALRRIWKHITESPLRKRGLIIDEFHNIIEEDKELMLMVIREIRKYYTAPTLSTQNVMLFLRSEEGKMIMDLCSIKILMRQGENDLEEITRLFDLSKYERMYLKTCDIGHGYIFTSGYKTKLQVVYSEKEEQILTTDPRRKVTI